LEERILLVAPHGRDAEVIEHVLSREGLHCVICPNVGTLVTRLANGAACGLITDEALDDHALQLLGEWLNAQPPWSDFPFVLLVGNGKKGVLTAEGRRLQLLGNVVLIERPVSGEALVSAARSALRARRRQYQARAMLAERAAANLRLVNAARQKDEFLAMLAHELRNPLAPIRHAAEAIRTAEGVLPSRVQWAREIIERQSRHLASLLEDLLDVSRITTGKVTLKRSPVELGAILRAAIDAANLALEARRHTLTLKTPDAPIYLDGDPTRLAQVFGNLLDNAAKYTPDGGQITISVSTHLQTVTVAVEDNGTGIAPDELLEVFELFSQSSRALDRAQGGLGIGLSVVRSLIDMHGGTVHAQSDGLGKGTCVVVTLPIVASPLPQPESDDVKPVQRHALRVLVVDDNVDAADSLAALLELGGHSVLTASDGPEALRACEIEPPDVVLLDIGLPGMDGYAVARRLKQMLRKGRLTLIAITGYGQPEDVARAKDAGFDHHLVKPVEPETLALLLADVRRT
jgi:signal transduction histidine kinase